TRVLSPYQMSQRERYSLCRREPVFTVQNHRVRAVQHEDRRARTLVLGLMHHQILILEVYRHAKAFALDGRLERGVYVEIERVSKLISSRRLARVHAGREMVCIVAAE